MAKNNYLCEAKDHPFMITLDTIRKPVEADLQAFDEFVARQFTAEGDLLDEMLRYALSSRGKGIRPTLVMLSAAMNAPQETERLGLRVSLAAMLVEMIHVASLIHDDVIDESSERRGRASVNARWQSHKAVLLGDFILARNMNIGMSSGQYDIVAHVCSSLTALCEGEIFQSDCAEKGTMTRQSYLDIIRKKTASLLGTSASVGALAVRAPHERVVLMRNFGEALGMASRFRTTSSTIRRRPIRASRSTTTCVKGKSRCRCWRCSTVRAKSAAPSCSRCLPAAARRRPPSSSSARRWSAKGALLLPPR